MKPRMSRSRFSIGLFYLDDVLDTHFVALGILDDGNGAVKFVEFQVMIMVMALPALIWSSTKPS